MTVHVVMPVFNRLELTKVALKCITSQVVDESINIIVVDDGSTDGTGEYLLEQNNITILYGDGSLWWGGCVDIAFKHILKISEEDDYILLANNDTQFKPGFLKHMLNTSRQNNPAAVGSVVLNEDAPHNVLSYGAIIDSWWLLVKDKLNLISSNNEDALKIFEVDALSGRGVLFPVSVIKIVGGMRPRYLPHYLADYELSLRVKKAGYKLLVDTNAAIYSKDDFSNTQPFLSIKEKLFSLRSPSFLPAVITFWWEASNILQRITLPMRLIIFLLFPNLRAARK